MLINVNARISGETLSLPFDSIQVASFHCSQFGPTCVGIRSRASNNGREIYMIRRSANDNNDLESCAEQEQCVSYTKDNLLTCTFGDIGPSFLNDNFLNQERTDLVPNFDFPSHAGPTGQFLIPWLNFDGSASTTEQRFSNRISAISGSYLCHLLTTVRFDKQYCDHVRFSHFTVTFNNDVEYEFTSLSSRKLNGGTINFQFQRDDSGILGPGAPLQSFNVNVMQQRLRDVAGWPEDDITNLFSLY
eukprot:Awhi_evm2s14740